MTKPEGEACATPILPSPVTIGLLGFVSGIHRCSNSPNDEFSTGRIERLLRTQETAAKSNEFDSRCRWSNETAAPECETESSPGSNEREYERCRSGID